MMSALIFRRAQLFVERALSGPQKRAEGTELYCDRVGGLGRLAHRRINLFMQ